MTRILLLITDLEIGGTPTVVREVAVRLKAAGGADVEVACLSRWGPVADQLVRAGIVVTAFGARSAFDFPEAVLQLARRIRRRNIETVFSFLVHANAVAATTSRICPGVRWLQSIQTTQPTPRWHWRVQALAQHAVERVVVPSASVAAVAMDWAEVPPEKINIIPNAIDMAEFRGAGGSRVSSDLSLVDPNRPRRQGGLQIGFIGRLDPIKRIGDMIDAIALLDASVHLHLFGEGPQRAFLEATIARLNLNSRVTLHGAIARPQEALDMLDLLILPSQAEGFGLVLIEAMAAGVAVVATNVPGIRDVVRHGETGLLVPVASPPDLANAAASILNNPSLKQRLISNALNDVQQRFTWDIVLPQYQRVLGINASA